MEKLLKEFKESYLDSLLSFLWKQWSAIGVSGYSNSKDNWYIDPEALLVFSCSIARYDARLFDEMINWLNINGSYINIQRLKNIAGAENFNGTKVLSAVAKVMSKRQKFLKWKGISAINDISLNEVEPLFYFKNGLPIQNFGEAEKDFREYGFLRGKIEFRKHIQPVNITKNTGLLFKLRALFGVSARCDIILYLLTHESAHPQIISKEIYYSQKSVQDTLVEMVKSDLIFVRSIGREKHYWLNKTTWSEFLKSDDKSLRWVKWPALMSALETIWIKINDKAFLEYDSLLKSSELRILMRSIMSKIQDAGFADSISENKYYLGEDYQQVFLSDITRLLNVLK